MRSGKHTKGKQLAAVGGRKNVLEEQRLGQSPREFWLVPYATNEEGKRKE